MEKPHHWLAKWLAGALLILFAVLHGIQVYADGVTPSAGGSFGRFSSLDSFQLRRIIYTARDSEGAEHLVRVKQNMFYKAHGLSPQDIHSMRADPDNQNLKVMMSYLIKSDFRESRGKLFVHRSYFYKDKKPAYSQRKLEDPKNIKIVGLKATFVRPEFDQSSNKFYWEEYHPPITFGTWQ